MFKNSTINLSALCNSRAKIACCSSELIVTFLYAGSSNQKSERSVRLIHPPSKKRAISSSDTSTFKKASDQFV
jgi:hypothetical protein